MTFSSAVYATMGTSEWITLTGALPAPRFAGSALVFQDQVWYLGGCHDATMIPTSSVYSTTTGNTWLTSGSLPGPNGYMGAVTFTAP